MQFDVLLAGERFTQLRFTPFELFVGLSAKITGWLRVAAWR